MNSKMGIVVTSSLKFLNFNKEKKIVSNQMGSKEKYSRL